MRPRQKLDCRRTWHCLVGVPLIALTLLISGCSTRFVYNRLDTLASWYFESLVSLNDGQRTELRSWLENTLRWHRESELARYASFVGDVSQSLEKPSGYPIYASNVERFQVLMQDLLHKTAPDAARLLMQLSPQQVDELLSNLDEKTQETLEKSAKAVAKNEWRPEQVKDLTRQVKRWAGSVSKEQKQMIAATVATLEPTYDDWAQSQRAWRAALRAAIAAARVSEDDAPTAQLLALLENPDAKWTEAYSQKTRRNRERYLQLLADLDGSLSNEQRQHVRAELDRLANNLARLAKG